MYLAGFFIVLVYTFSRHIPFGLFNKEAAHFVMNPFYNDHTSYGAALGLYIPIVTAFIFITKNGSLRVFFMVVLFLLLAALLFSYTRAAWISVLLAFALAIVIKLRIKLVYISIIFVIMLSLFFTFRFQIIDRLQKNRQDSSDELTEHVKSISNIATDASNLERLNRWNAAFQMTAIRPLLGWGPGTYMFQYAPFQMAADRTIISTNFGEVGNAHSEYIGALAESGIPALILFILIIVFTINTGIRLYQKVPDPHFKILILGVIAALFTYYIHGLLNNFLDTDKLSVPFWGFTAFLVAMDLHYANKQT